MSGLFGSSSQRAPQVTTTTTNNAPWGPSQSYLKDSMAKASALQKAGTGAAVYEGSQVVPFAQQTQQGMNSIMNTAQGSGQQMANQYGNVIGQGGMNEAMQAGSDVTGGFAQGTGPSNSEQNLQGYASGAMFGQNDPHFERMLQMSKDAAADEVNLSASAAGRYGGGIHQGSLAEGIGDIDAKARFSQMTDLRNRQFAANNQMDNFAGQNMNRQLAAAGQQFGQGQQAFDNLGTAYNNAKAPAQDMLNVGSMYEDLNRREKNDDIRIFNEQQQNPWRSLGQANAIYSGAGSMGGSSTGSAAVPDNRPSFLQQALGTGMQLYGAGGF